MRISVRRAVGATAVAVVAAVGTASIAGAAAPPKFQTTVNDNFLPGGGIEFVVQPVPSVVPTGTYKVGSCQQLGCPARTGRCRRTARGHHCAGVHRAHRRGERRGAATGRKPLRQGRSSRSRARITRSCSTTRFQGNTASSARSSAPTAYRTTRRGSSGSSTSCPRRRQVSVRRVATRLRGDPLHVPVQPAGRSIRSPARREDDEGRCGHASQARGEVRPALAC